MRNAAYNGKLAALLVFLFFCATNSSFASEDPLANWRWRSRAGDSLNGVAYGNGTFVAVGDEGTILTSPDGTTLTAQDSGTGNDLHGVAYGNGVFVAVGFWRIQTSPDGVTWTDQTHGITSILRGVAYGNGKFVAVGWSGAILTSPDGVTWTASQLGVPSLEEVTYGNGKFVAVGRYGYIMTSPDGLTWTGQSLEGSRLYGVTYGNGTFVTVGGYCNYDAYGRLIGCDGTLLTSPDGVDWTPQPSGATNVLRGVTYGNGTFIAVGGEYDYGPNGYFLGSAGEILKSSDGVNWATQPSETTNALYGVTYGNGKFFAVGGYQAILISSDGATWTTRSSGSSNFLGGVTYGNGTFVAVAGGRCGSDYDSCAGTILTSQDGRTWTVQSSEAIKSLYGVTYGKEMFIAVGGEGTILTSPDSVTWTAQSSETTNDLNGVTYDNGMFVVVGDQGTILTSPDGVTWTDHSLKVYDDFASVTYGNGIFVVVGHQSVTGTVLISPDGVIWTVQLWGTIGPLSEVTYGNGMFVAVGTQYDYAGDVTGLLLVTSTDGVTWTNRIKTIKGIKSKPLQGVTYGSGVFIALGGGAILSSPDGLTWTTQMSGITDALRGVTYGNVTSTFVAVGYAGNWQSQETQGTILQSDPFFSVSATSTTQSGYYKAGSNINITLNFSQPVSSTGLTINLNTGALIATGSFSNQTSWSGAYTVTAGQNVSPFSISTISGTLTNTNGVTAAGMLARQYSEFEDNNNRHHTADGYNKQPLGNKNQKRTGEVYSDVQRFEFQRE